MGCHPATQWCEEAGIHIQRARADGPDTAVLPVVQFKDVKEIKERYFA